MAAPFLPFGTNSAQKQANYVVDPRRQSVKLDKTMNGLKECLDENSEIMKAFTKFLEDTLSLENLLFYLDAVRYQQLTNKEELKSAYNVIMERYFTRGAVEEVNIGEEQLVTIENCVEPNASTFLLIQEDILLNALTISWSQFNDSREWDDKFSQQRRRSKSVTFVQTEKPGNVLALRKTVSHEVTTLSKSIQDDEEDEEPEKEEDKEAGKESEAGEEDSAQLKGGKKKSRSFGNVFIDFLKGKPRSRSRSVGKILPY